MEHDQLDFEQHLRRQKQMSLLLMILGIVLWLSSFAVRLLNIDKGEDFHFAWNLFSYLALWLVIYPSEYRRNRFRNMTRNSFYLEKARLEENDERKQLIERMAWEHTGKLLSWVLLAAMFVSLALVQLAVFWSCLAVYLLLWGSWWLLRRHYWERM